MAKQTIDLGTTANDHTGTDLRAAGDMINDNFDELYGYQDIGEIRGYYTNNSRIKCSIWINACNCWNWISIKLYKYTNSRIIPVLYIIE